MWPRGVVSHRAPEGQWVDHLMARFFQIAHRAQLC
jgi:hypothetical protein